MIRNVLGWACALALLVVGLGGDAAPDRRTRRTRDRANGDAPVSRFSRNPPCRASQVDPLWPKPLPNHWLFGSITGVAVDAQNHIWVVHRGADSLNARTEMSAATNPPTADECCHPAPAVLEFDEAGALVSHWGGPGDGYEWPRSPGGIAVDAKGNVWIAAAGVIDARRRRARPRRRRRPRAATGRRARAEVLARRKVPPADRQGRPAWRQRQHDRPVPPGRDRSGLRGQ